MHYISYALIIIFSATLTASIVGYFYKRRMRRTTELMAANAARIGRGDFSYKLPAQAGDGLAELAHIFNGMGDNLQAFMKDLQQRNANLTSERQKQDSILASVSDGIIAINKDHEIILANTPAAALIGKAPADITGSPLQAAFPFIKAGQDLVLDTAKSGTFQLTDITLHSAEKESFLELVVAVAPPVYDIAAIITVHDQTASRELEIMKLDFVAIAAHELRTPLTVARGYLDLVTSSPEITKLTVMNIEYLQRTKSGVTQLAELINNILNVSRIERNTLQIALEKVDLALLLKHATDQERVTAQLHHQILDYEWPPHKLFVVADESAITEVVTNLISNAIKYSPENSKITIRLLEEDGQARVEVTDNGRGIPEASKAHLFTKFYRVENSLTTGNRGTGLGLYICKNIIELHHGMIDVTSKLGSGSTFFFKLPLYDEAQHPELTANTKELGGIHGWFQNVLIVEDEVMIRELYYLSLTKAGYRTILAGSGAEAFKQLQDFTPDIVFLDIMLPEMSGIDILKTLRTDPAHNCQNAKIVLITNLGQENLADVAIKEHADGYIIKADILPKDLVTIAKSLEHQGDEKDAPHDDNLGLNL